MDTPICPRTLAPVWRFGNEATNEDLARSRYPDATSCIGSECALWVHEAAKVQHLETNREQLVLLDPHRDRDIANVVTYRRTGNGLCADNLRAVPWPDPAAPLSSVKEST